MLPSVPFEQCLGPNCGPKTLYTVLYTVLLVYMYTVILVQYSVIGIYVYSVIGMPTAKTGPHTGSYSRLYLPDPCGGHAFHD